MRVISDSSLCALLVIVLGMPLLLYIKLNKPNVYTYNIVIAGNPKEAVMLAYYLDRHIKRQTHLYQGVLQFNVTLVAPAQSPKIKQTYGQILEKQMISFCGVEREWMAVLDDTSLKYNIKQYGIYFAETVDSNDKTDFNVYSTETSFLSSFASYGLSNYAARDFFQKFAASINQTHPQNDQNSRNSQQNSHTLDQLSSSRIIRSYLPQLMQEEGFKYFSQTLGLDSAYIQNFIVPIILGNYLHDANSLSTLFKLMPAFCERRGIMGKALILHQTHQKVIKRLLQSIKTVQINFIQNLSISAQSLVKHPLNPKRRLVRSVLSPIGSTEEDFNHNNTQFGTAFNQSGRLQLTSDILFSFTQEGVASGKQYSYYKTVIDGKVKNDDNYEQFFTIYLKNRPKKRQEAKQERRQNEGKVGERRYSYNPIYSITRLCAQNCKGYEHSVYLLISKHKLTSSKQLAMFQTHNIVSFRKFFMPKAQMPSNKQIKEHENIYKIYDISHISDSLQVQLNTVKALANAIINKIKQQHLM